LYNEVLEDRDFAKVYIKTVKASSRKYRNPGFKP